MRASGNWSVPVRRTTRRWKPSVHGARRWLPIASLLFLEVRRGGLVASVRELAARFEASSGIVTPVHVTGTPRPLTAELTEALFRVAHESLMNVQRHSRASVAAVCLIYGDE